MNARLPASRHYVTGVPVPSVIASRSRRMLSRAWLSVQKSLNVGVGARLNTLEAFTVRPKPRTF